MSIKELLSGKKKAEAPFQLPEREDIYYLISGSSFVMNNIQYENIKDIIEGEGYDLFYVPDIIKSLGKDVMKYNFPGVKNDFTQDKFSSSVAKYLEIDLNEGDACLVWYNEELSSFEHTLPHDSYESLHAQIYELFNSVPVEISPNVNFRIGSGDNIDECCDCCMDFPMEDAESSLPQINESRARKSFLRNIFHAENSLYDLCDDIDYEEAESEAKPTSELETLAEEAKEAIDRLLLSGFSAEVIKSWLEPKVKLSRLRITKRFKIILVDYDMEVKMGPLPKTVFLFFLKHPEGLRFVDLQDYRQDIYDIYSRLSVSDDIDKIKRSVDLLTDPFDNSINEKCTMIKYAFQKVVKDEIASNYYVSGKQGDIMRIPLDRELVEWE